MAELDTALVEALKESAERQRLRIEPSRVNELQQAIKDGRTFEPKDLFTILISGSPDEKIAFRALLATPIAAARSQDLVLSHVLPALRGDKSARAHVETNRLILDENLPAWIKPHWETGADAAWRNIDLHSTRAKIYVHRKFGTEVLPQYRIKSLPAYKPQVLSSEGDPQVEQLNSDLDPRGALFSLASVIALRDAAPKAIKESQHHTREALFSLMKNEVELDLKLMLSPTLMGDLYREKAVDEAKAKFCAFLIEDLVLALDLPASATVRLQCWRDYRFYPWNLSDSRLFKHGPEIVKTLRERFLDEETVEGEFETILLLDQSGFRQFKKSLHPKIATSDSTQSGSVSGPGLEPRVKETSYRYVPPRNRRLEILAAIESYRGSAEEHRRYARVFAKLVGDSDQRQTRVMTALEHGGDLEELALAFRTERIQAQRLSKDPLDSVVPDQSGDPSKVRQRLFGSEGVVDERETVMLTFTSEATGALDDGRIRHSVSSELLKLVETPEIADTKKLIGVQGVRELRVLSTGVRVYFLRVNPTHLRVLLIGKRGEQERDVARLPALRDRELAKLKNVTV